MTLQRRYLDACRDYHLAHALDHPRQGLLVAMQQAEADLAALDAVLARLATQEAP